MTGWIVGVAIAVVVLLVAEATSIRWWRRSAKMVASSGFIAVAIASGALDSAYGTVLLVGFCLAWVGDLLLTFEARRAFLFGLGAFLLGHVAYLIAFIVRGVDIQVVMLSTGVVAVVAFSVWWWLGPHLGDAMVVPVAAYVLVISAMVVGAFGTSALEPNTRIVLGAIAFFVSDLAVARNRFVHPGFLNRLWGLPLYYLGQVLLALSVG